MSRVNVELHVFNGYLLAKIDQLRCLISRLNVPVVIGQTELESINEDINRVEADVRDRHQRIQDEAMRPSLVHFEVVWERALSTLTERVGNRGRPLPPSSPLPSTSTANATEPSMPDHDESRQANDLRHVLTDRKYDKGPAFWPIGVPSSSLRSMPMSKILSDAVAAENSSSEWEYDGPLVFERTGNDRRPETVQVDRTRSVNPVRSANPVRSVNLVDSGRSINSVRPAKKGAMLLSRASCQAVAMRRQQVHNAPQDRVSYPRFRNEPPVELAPGPDLIGMAEMYVRPPPKKLSCPLCRGAHRMIRCANLYQLSLEERWYEALMGGVCLNCLRPGHSSLTCFTVGACRRCGMRHNSSLCPRNPDNQ